ncbi:MAG: C-GCAxxG-C-C family protein [Anaerolineae bacterium]|nr:C-GCAxxG-C-C family protein [Anaerolineae bacterium]
MQAMLDVSETDARWLVKLTAGLPGGIGNTGGECGGVTAPLVLLGLRYGQEQPVQGLPVVVYKGHDLLQRFVDSQGTTACREILGNARVPLRCIGVVRRAPVLCAETIGADCTAAISAAQGEAFGRLYAHWLKQKFHCAHAVFHHLEDTIPVSEDLLNGSSGFMGGTAFTGMTCSALAAGVMALGLMFGQIENSHLRVLRMIGLMAVRGDAFADAVNAFNKTMNLGNRLAQWFTVEFGSTQCRELTQCDFSTLEGVHRYIDDGGTARCSAMAQSVAHRVLSMIQSADTVESVQSVHVKAT